MPAHGLMELAKRLHDEAEQVLVGKAPSCNEAPQRQSSSVSR